MTGNVILPMIPIAVTDWFSLHNSICGLYVDKKSCDFRQYYNAPLPFAHEQVGFGYKLGLKRIVISGFEYS